MLPLASGFFIFNFLKFNLIKQTQLMNFPPQRLYPNLPEGFPGGSVVKSSSDKAGDTDSIPGLGRSPRVGNGTGFSILAWKIPWTEEPGRLQFMGSQRVRHDWKPSLYLEAHWAPCPAPCTNTWVKYQLHFCCCCCFSSFEVTFYYTRSADLQDCFYTYAAMNNSSVNFKSNEI